VGVIGGRVTIEVVVVGYAEGRRPRCTMLGVLEMYSPQEFFVVVVLDECLVRIVHIFRPLRSIHELVSIVPVIIRYCSLFEIPSS
jgi:hypothetical protein